MESIAHVVIVDDEASVRHLVQRYLTDNGFAVSACADGDELRQLMSERAVDLVILDMRMPGEQGTSIAKRLRDAGPIGIIMLTANTDPVDKVVALEIGADDYLTKPFDPRELLARVRSVLRRAASEEPISTMGTEVALGELRLNLESRKLYEPNGSELPLTASEFDLLHTFIKNPSRVLSRDQLLDLAFKDDGNVFDRSIDMRVARLRQKIERNPRHPQLIRTVRGMGYIFSPAS